MARDGQINSVMAMLLLVMPLLLPCCSRAVSRDTNRQASLTKIILRLNLRPNTHPKCGKFGDDTSKHPRKVLSRLSKCTAIADLEYCSRVCVGVTMIAFSHTALVAVTEPVQPSIDSRYLSSTLTTSIGRRQV